MPLSMKLITLRRAAKLEGETIPEMFWLSYTNVQRMFRSYGKWEAGTSHAIIYGNLEP
jgi:hypothetical protein